MSDTLKLWFFRDLNDEQRLKLFGLFGLPVDEIGPVHARQTIALQHIIKKLVDLVRDESGTPAPNSHVEGFDLPADVIESLLAIGAVEWGVSLTQSDEKHASDLLDTLRITREHFGVTDEETGIHGVYLEGTGTVLAHTGMSPNSPQHARILVGAWNQLVEIAKARSTAAEDGR